MWFIYTQQGWQQVNSDAEVFALIRQGVLGGDHLIRHMSWSAAVPIRRAPPFTSLYSGHSVPLLVFLAKAVAAIGLLGLFYLWWGVGLALGIVGVTLVVVALVGSKFKGILRDFALALRKHLLLLVAASVGFLLVGSFGISAATRHKKACEVAIDAANSAVAQTPRLGAAALTARKAALNSQCEDAYMMPSHTKVDLTRDSIDSILTTVAANEKTAHDAMEVQSRINTYLSTNIPQALAELTAANDLIVHHGNDPATLDSVFRTLRDAEWTAEVAKDLKSDELQLKRTELKAALLKFRTKHAAYLKRAADAAQKLSAERVARTASRGDQQEAELMVSRVIKASLKNPDSYEYVAGFSTGTAAGPYWVITWTYKGTNSFGGIIQTTEIYCVKAGPVKSMEVCPAEYR